MLEFAIVREMGMRRIVLAGIVLTWFICGAGSLAEAQQKDALTTFMRVQLVHAQKALEGLTMEDFESIAKESQAMALLSQDAQWKVLQTQEYLQRSTEFRRAVDALTESAKKKNLDGATLAYVDVTMKCVECHKYVRRIRQAQDQTPVVPGTIKR
jgi:hypothetical protein